MGEFAEQARLRFINDYTKSSDPALKVAAFDLLGNHMAAAWYRGFHRVGQVEREDARRHIERAWEVFAAEVTTEEPPRAVPVHDERSETVVDPLHDCDEDGEIPCSICGYRSGMYDVPGGAGSQPAEPESGPARVREQLRQAGVNLPHETVPLPSTFHNGGEIRDLVIEPGFRSMRPLTEEQRARMLDPIENAKLAVKLYGQRLMPYERPVTVQIEDPAYTTESVRAALLRAMRLTPDPVWERRRRDRDRREARGRHGQEV